MEFKQIQELVKLINKSQLTELHIEQENFKITLKKEQKADEQAALPGVPAVPVVSQPMPYAAPQQQPVVAPAPEKPAGDVAGGEPAAKTDESQLVTIKSPMIGTFYRSPSPDKPVFVNVGDDIAPGKVVCIIEAMKLFNEVESEISGKIVKILVDDASPVEYDQPLFLVEP